MTNRERALAILNYTPYDKMPVVHFGFWRKTLDKWANEGHITPEEAEGWTDGNRHDRTIRERLGFDFNWNTLFTPRTGLTPPFAPEIIEETPDGFQKVLNPDGMIVLQRGDAGSIPAEVDHLLKGRQEWEEHYLPRLRFSAERVDKEALESLRAETNGEVPLGLHCGSLFGQIRNWLGVEGISYLYADDEELYDEIIHTVGELCYRTTETALASGARFDFGHFWEDICFKNGPLVSPSVFSVKVGPHYRRITALLRRHGINIVSLDCDGMIDALIPTWFENGVNTMFPIEVGTWESSIAPWREAYGRDLRGVGGMNKNVFSQDYAAVDREIERLRPLVALGGYIPCPDHRLAPDAKWENIQHYCDRLQRIVW